MKLSVTILAALAAACRLAVATPVPDEPSLDIASQNKSSYVEEMERKGFSYAPMKWTGRIDNSGDNYTFYGSMQDIESQAQKFNPEFRFAPKNESEVQALKDMMRLQHSEREGYVNCHLHDWPARTYQVERMLAWQWAMQGECSLLPNRCGQVQCVGDKSRVYWISWCNLRNYEFITSCTAMAWGADWILDECDNKEWFGRDYIRGEHFSNGNRMDNDFRTYVGGSRFCETGHTTSPGWPPKKNGVDIVAGDGGDGGRNE